MTKTKQNNTQKQTNKQNNSSKILLYLFPIPDSSTQNVEEEFKSHLACFKIQDQKYKQQLN